MISFNLHPYICGMHVYLFISVAFWFHTLGFKNLTNGMGLFLLPNFTYIDILGNICFSFSKYKTLCWTAKCVHM